jgi:hypothetical protein
MGGAFRHPTGWPETVEVISDVMENLPFERTDLHWISAGEFATFIWADRPLDYGTGGGLAKSILHVAVNTATGFGA